MVDCGSLRQIGQSGQIDQSDQIDQSLSTDKRGTGTCDACPF